VAQGTGSQTVIASKPPADDPLLKPPLADDPRQALISSAVRRYLYIPITYAVSSTAGRGSAVLFIP
jgi:hypothetical protein